VIQVGNCTCRGREKRIRGFSKKNPGGKKRNWENAGIDGSIILECSLKRAAGKAWIGLIYLRRETSGGICERRNVTSVSIIWGKLIY
jgi:hypothetical protein